MPTFWKDFFLNHKWVLNFVESFFCIYWDKIMWFLSLNLLIWCITLIDLRILKILCIIGKKPTSSWYMILSICCWILFATILLKIFASMFINDISYNFLSFFLSFFFFFGNIFVSGWWWPHRISLGMFFWNFWKSLRRIGISSSRNVW